MGFKRTSEGRVFFQGSEQTANDHYNASQNQNTQLQILTLLKALNEKLQSTQADRKNMRKELQAYRALVEDLEKRAVRSEQAYQALEQKIGRADSSAEAKAVRAEQLAKETLKEMEEARKLMLELEDKADKADQGVILLTTQLVETKKLGEEITRKQVQLEKQQKDQTSRIDTGSETYKALLARIQDAEQKHSQLSKKIDETAAEHEKLVRKIDKAVEDRMRFMRKIERIEETVLQTRDALNAKAMVLLTEQGKSAHAPVQGEQILAATPHGDLDSPEAGPDPEPDAYRDSLAVVTWWRRRVRLEAAAVFFLVVASVLVGWLISEVQKPQVAGPGSFELADLIPDSLPSPFGTESQQPGPPTAPAPADPDWRISRDTAQFSEQEVAPAPYEPSAGPNPADDLGTIDLNDQQQLATLLAEDPDALAEELNKIEPSLTETGQAILDGSRGKSEYTAQASLPPAESVSEFSASSMPAPDPALPEVIKDIETQAFEGVPAAQHDLAAIYTAGHGGVPQNYARAAQWFRQAADAGVANAAYNLGVMYHQGLGMSADITQAIEWYKKAATLGHPEAQYNLGIAYIEGIGVDYNPGVAAGYFQNAAEQGIMEAAYNLGLIFENGLLGDPKPDTALLWYKTAADQGSPEAKAALEQLAKTLGISLLDVNRLVDSMKAVQKTKETAKTDKKASADTTAAPSPVKPAVNAEQVLLAQIQQKLIEEGLYPGPADGLNGPLTKDAIRSYQAMNNLDVTGQPSEELLSFMLSDYGIEEGPGELGSRDQ